ncbi:MAG TPA: hypothetical protein V6C52_01115 [Coleofasciculaceae cyanobacterium]|jgi:hypothetical protein
MVSLNGGNSAWRARSSEQAKPDVLCNNVYQVQNGDTYYVLADTYKKEFGSNVDLNTLVQRMQEQTGQDAGHLGVGTKIDFSKLEDTKAGAAQNKNQGNGPTFNDDPKADVRNFIAPETAKNSDEAAPKKNSIQERRVGVNTTVLKGPDGFKSAQTDTTGASAGHSIGKNGEIKVAGENQYGGAVAGHVNRDGVEKQSLFNGRQDAQITREGYTVNINGNPKGTLEKRIITRPGENGVRTETIRKGSGYDRIAGDQELMGQIGRFSQDKAKNTFDTGMDADDLKALRSANQDAWKDITDAQIADFVNTSKLRSFDFFGADVSADDLKRSKEEYGLQ